MKQAFVHNSVFCLLTACNRAPPIVPISCHGVSFAFLLPLQNLRRLHSHMVIISLEDHWIFFQVTFFLLAAAEEILILISDGLLS